MPERDDERLRAFWSGTLTFGLVSLPVGFLPANRPRRLSLRQLDQDGTPLRRRWWCPREQRLVDDEEIVRGGEIEDGTFVVITDEELEALEPEKTREIDLREFVDRDDVDPSYFERAYFLAPMGEGLKAYRLLAEAMEATGKIGIGTFVMRDKEYVAAILAENGILRAETMRFHDELRSADEVGLPDKGRAPAREVQRISAAIGARRSAAPDWDLFEDRATREIERIVERKLRTGQDVVEPPPEAIEEVEEAEVIDIMEVLKRSLKARNREDLDRRSREELYAMAKERDIAGRSRMSKAELIRAIRRSA